MHVPPLIALFAWIPIGLFIFYRYPTRKAILATVIGGWAVLPSANYLPSNNPFPYWIMGVALPSTYLVTKATIIGLTAILGTAFFDFKTLRSFRPGLGDAPILLWCIVPFFAGLANTGELRAGCAGVIYQVLAWGVPYLLGRIYFADSDPLLLAVKAFILAGLLYIPICLIEIAFGPQLYAHLYGYQPFRWVGAARYIGYRPIGFLEDGNQLGIWMAFASLLAIGLWLKHKQIPRIKKDRHPEPGGAELQVRPSSHQARLLAFIAIALTVTTILCKSGGSILLLALMLPFALGGRRFQKTLAAVLIFGIVLLAGLRLTNAISLRSLVERNAIAYDAKELLIRIGRESFGWRLAQDERHVSVALRHPVLGSGQWNWWQEGLDRPWGLWLLTFGMYGIVGLLSLESLQFLPIVRTAWQSPRSGAPWLRYIVSAALLMVAIDSFMNSTFLLPVLLLTGSLSTQEIVPKVDGPPLY